MMAAVRSFEELAVKKGRHSIIKDAKKYEVTDEKCRLCGDSLENVRHILSGCSALAQTKYVQRHNNAFKILFFEVLRSLDLITKV